MQSHPMIIAHRGASGYRPEHTRAAYNLALDLGADAIEPDIVFTKDHVPVIRHDFYLGDSTDVAERPEFADRRTRRSFVGHTIENWFVIDFLWREIQSLYCRERIPEVRPLNADFVDERILRLSELVALIVQHNTERFERSDRDSRDPIALVLEVKQATLHEQFGVDVVGQILADLEAGGWFSAVNPGALIIESFELPILQKFRDRDVAAEYVFLVEEGTPVDELFRESIEPEYSAHSFDEFLSDSGMQQLVDVVDGISFKKSFLLKFTDGGALVSSGLAEQAQGLGLKTYAWTLRPEAKFLERVKAGKAPMPAADRDDDFGLPERAGPVEDSRLWQEEFAILMETGLDGVFVDHPDLALEIRTALQQSR